MHKVGRRFLIGGGVIVCCVLAFPMAHRVLYGVPEIVYRFQSTAIKDECAQIQKGMKPDQVIEVFKNGPVPMQQNITGNRVLFGTTAGACYIDLDPDGVVSSTHLGRPIWEY